MRSVRPEHNDAFWETLADRDWRRVRWRRSRGDANPRPGTDVPPEDAVCIAFGTPIHRTGTYYVRPAYTDGADWLCQQAYDTMIRRVRQRRASRRTGERPS
ncbi:MAG: hypothetical protein AAGK21_15720 [Bacteroidota bacterium]